MQSTTSVRPLNYEDRTYPYLGAWLNDFVVLFTDHNTGTVIWIREGFATAHRLGTTMPNWSEKEFTVFTGSITLSN